MKYCVWYYHCTIYQNYAQGKSPISFVETSVEDLIEKAQKVSSS